jgi:ribose transport system substrate-binding protein
VVALAAAVAMVGAACSSNSGSNSSNSGSGKKELKITFVAGNLPNPYYHSLYAGAAKKAKELGNVKLALQGGANFEATDENRVLDSVLTTKPDALIAAPVSETAVTPTLRKFKNAGIPIITVDGAIQDDSIITSAIGADHYQGGQAAADEMAKRLNKKGTVGVFAIGPGVPATNQRAAGFVDKVKKDYPDIKVLDIQYTGTSLPKGQSTAQSMMAANPDLNGFFATQFWATEGIATALKLENKTKSVTLIGYDALSSEVSLVKEGSAQALIVQTPFQIGEMAMQAAYDALTGKTDQIKKKNVLNNVVMTQDNLSDPKVADLVYQEQKPPVG